MIDVLRIHRIHWRDAKFSAGWHFKEEIPTTPAIVQSVGWLVSETEEAVTLALSVSNDTDTVAQLSVIPKSNITERWCISDSQDWHHLHRTSIHVKMFKTN